MFRARSGVWRWRDPGWLVWLIVLAYLLHNFEQYGVDAKGRAFHFPVIACAQYGFDSVTGCPLAPSSFVAVCIAFIGIVLPAAALWCRWNSAVGLTGVDLVFNALSRNTA